MKLSKEEKELNEAKGTHLLPHKFSWDFVFQCQQCGEYCDKLADEFKIVFDSDKDGNRVQSRP